MSETITASGTPDSSANRASPEQTGWLQSFLGGAAATVSDAVTTVENTASEAYEGAAGAIASIPQRLSDAGDAITDWRKHTIGVFDSERTPVKTYEQEMKEKKDAIQEMQRREQAAQDAEREHWRKVDEQTMADIRAKLQAEAEQKQREEADRKAMQEEYDEIRRRLRPVN